MIKAITTGGKFEGGMLVLTRAVNDKVALESSFAKLIFQSLRRHFNCDWGDLSEQDKKENEYSLTRHLRIMSAYKKDGIKIWIITEADRSATTVLFPEEY